MKPARNLSKLVGASAFLAAGPLARSFFLPLSCSYHSRVVFKALHTSKQEENRRTYLFIQKWGTVELALVSVGEHEVVF